MHAYVICQSASSQRSACAAIMQQCRHHRPATVRCNYQSSHCCTVVTAVRDGSCTLLRSHLQESAGPTAAAEEYETCPNTPDAASGAPCSTPDTPARPGTAAGAPPHFRHAEARAPRLICTATSTLTFSDCLHVLSESLQAEPGGHSPRHSRPGYVRPHAPRSVAHCLPWVIPHTSRPLHCDKQPRSSGSHLLLPVPLQPT